MAEKIVRPILTYADEFHHAVTDQYQRIVNYFKPQFMLGLTATPERMDGKSIYEICDYNVPYEITLKKVINKLEKAAPEIVRMDGADLPA